MKSPIKLHAPYKPSKDQARAIDALVKNFEGGSKHEALLGVTGSGKTYIMANVIERLQRPTLILSHNKTLAAQLYQEFKEFFPDGDVHYFVSYYDYYQPEAYMPTTDTYIEKDAQINDFIDQLRHAATAAVLTAPCPIIIASVSAIYGLADPQEYLNMSTEFNSGMAMRRKDFLARLADLQYYRNDIEHTPGTFAVRGEVVDVISPDGERETRFVFFGDEIEQILIRKHGVMDAPYDKIPLVRIFPAKHFVTTEPRLHAAIEKIEKEVVSRLKELEGMGKILEAERLRQRTGHDIAMLRETGYCSGIENYSRHIDGRSAGSPPSTLIDYFGDNFLTFIDESHMTLPQIRGMQNGDRARKMTLVDHGFRLPSALDNRPLTFDEFENHMKLQLYVSATPNDYEREQSEHVTELLTRPTGLLDPIITVRPTENQMKETIDLVIKNRNKGERSLVICLTKRNAEDIATYMQEHGVNTAWIHSEVKTLDRPKILADLRSGIYDVLVGINLLREGIDLPEVSLVCILDADKEGFLRNTTTLVQTVGRASRHLNGRVVFFGDKMTDSMKTTIEETKRRREHQKASNKRYGIVPTALVSKSSLSLFSNNKSKDMKAELQSTIARAAKNTKSKTALRHEIEAEMLEAANALDFERAALLRDALADIS